jgi:hypothetical protein
MNDNGNGTLAAAQPQPQPSAMVFPMVFTIKHEVDTVKLRNTLLIVLAVWLGGKMLLALLAKLLK